MFLEPLATGLVVGELADQDAIDGRPAFPHTLDSSSPSSRIHSTRNAGKPACVRLIEPSLSGLSRLLHRPPRPRRPLDDSRCWSAEQQSRQALSDGSINLTHAGLQRSRVLWIREMAGRKSEACGRKRAYHR